MTALSSNTLRPTALLALAAACALAIVARVQAFEGPPQQWLAGVTAPDSKTGVHKSADGKWIANSVVVTSRTTSADSAKSAGRKGATSAKAGLLSAAALQKLQADPLYGDQPLVVQRLLRKLASQSSTKGKIEGAWIAEERPVGEDKRGRQRINVVVVAPSSGITLQVPRVDQLMAQISASADQPSSLSAALLWTELHPNEPKACRHRLATALQASGLTQLSHAVLGEPAREDTPPAQPPQASLAGRFKAADAQPYHPGPARRLAQALQSEGYHTAAKLVAQTGTQSWADSESRSACAELAGTGGSAIAMPASIASLLAVDDLRMDSRTRTALLHGGSIPWAPNATATTSSDSPSRLQVAIRAFDAEPSKANAWVVLVALETSDQRVADALFRQAAVAAQPSPAQ